MTANKPELVNQSTPDGIFENRFYMKHELAEILKLSVRSIEKRMADGTLPFKKFGRAIRFPGNELNQL